LLGSHFQNTIMDNSEVSLKVERIDSAEFKLIEDDIVKAENPKKAVDLILLAPIYLK
jgi:hypothetical protein